MTFRVFATTVAIFLALAGTFARAQTSFEGKTVRLVNNFAAGGPADLFLRPFLPYLAKHIPGRPTVILETRPGAGGMVAANGIFNTASPDGLTIGYLVGITTQGLVGGDNIRFDPARFRWLGAVPQTQVLLARKDLQLATPRDLLNPARPLVLATTGLNSTTDMSNRLFLDMIGAKFQHVTGFPGQAESILALARGEVSLDTGGLTTYLARRESIRREGLYDAIVQRGELNADGTFRRSRLIPEIPSMPEVIAELNPSARNSVEFTANRSIVGAFAVHFGFMLPPGADDATVQTLRQAMSHAFTDPQARGEVREKLKIDYDFIDGPAAEGVVARLRSEFDANPRIGQLLNQLMTRR